MRVGLVVGRRLAVALTFNFGYKDFKYMCTMQHRAEGHVRSYPVLHGAQWHTPSVTHYDSSTRSTPRVDVGPRSVPESELGYVPCSLAAHFIAVSIQTVVQDGFHEHCAGCSGWATTHTGTSLWSHWSPFTQWQQRETTPARVDPTGVPATLRIHTSRVRCMRRCEGGMVHRGGSIASMCPGRSWDVRRPSAARWDRWGCTVPRSHRL
jgi:hypothetical protein